MCGGFIQSNEGLKRIKKTSFSEKEEILQQTVDCWPTVQILDLPAFIIVWAYAL